MKRILPVTALFTAFAAASPAIAADNVTAIVTITPGRNGEHTQTYRVDGLADVESCLYIGWADSMAMDTDNYDGNNTVVKCLQNGRIVNAQACYEGECKPLPTPLPRP